VGDPTSDREAARHVLERFLVAWGAAHSARDLDALETMYTEDVIFFGSAPGLRTDRAGVRRYFEALEEHAGSAVEFEVLAVTSPGAGVVEGASRATFHWSGHAGTPIRFTHTLVETEDGWRALCHHASPG
jgi:ketosteroid isomerase-like protein